MANNPVSALGYFFSGWGLISRKGIRHIVLLPLLLNTLLFIALIAYGLDQFQVFIDYLHTLLPSWLSWLNWLLWPLFVLTAVLVVMFGFSIVANFVSAPFNAMLADAVERHLGVEPAPGAAADPFTLKRFMRELVPALWDEVRKLLYYVLWLLPLLILLLIPVLNLAFPLLWFIFSAWMLALGYADYPMGNHNLKFKQQRVLLRRKRILVLSFGSLELLVAMVPLVNLLAMPAAVAGATKMWLNDFADLAKEETP